MALDGIKNVHYIAKRNRIITKMIDPPVMKSMINSNVQQSDRGQHLCKAFETSAPMTVSSSLVASAQKV